VKSFPKERFQIGAWVQIKASVEFHQGQYRRNEIRDPTYGQIVGAALRCLGKRESGRPTNYNEDYDPPYLTVEETMYVWLVRRGITNKPIEVLDEDLESPPVFEISDGKVTWPCHGLPWQHARRHSWTDAEREQLRENMSDAPRDKKGRWLA